LENLLYCTNILTISVIEQTISQEKLKISVLPRATATVHCNNLFALQAIEDGEKTWNSCLQRHLINVFFYTSCK